MLGKIAKTIFGSANDRFIKKQYKLVQKINALEADISKLSDEELKIKQKSSAAVLKKVKRWTICCRKLLPLFAKPPNVRWDSAIMMSSSSAVSFSIRE